ncbi:MULTISPECIES: zinc metallopeptidase [Anaerotruncus]|uniref:Zinc metallopeptidase n=2 Tax=Anaerotruncus TaxID=244127 RepID=A0A498CQX1_9FIRM|nr:MULTISPECIES: zinc metallopeptidase [Anaerotruncus]MBC3938889.1 zinc metallopeptidase [Anaerotruncus massiliensis (ex Togo et al. 2019)]MCQ4895514.1 zinc metallopeptidase [Anaerotruncus sp. DFI.9.16]RLL10843.1 zinc metallopeptidase [Anaerotruncus massiliensis (ex Liu et al. 2021)]
MFYPFDHYYLILVVPALLFAAWAQAQVSGAYNRYSRVRVSRGMTGAMAARRILDDNGLTGVRVERVAGKLSDHYDPGERVVRLSAGVYDSDSVASLGVAAHECGHAVQHATHYAPLTFRNAIIPITNFGSKLSIPLIIVGLFLSGTLVDIGLLLFSLVAVFQLVTLPVEFNASSRALATLENGNFLDRRELEGARKVLRAAALTYVAALLVSVAQLMRLILLFGNRRRD